MATGLRLLRTEGGPKRVNASQGRRRGFAIELSGLRQVGIPFLEILGREQTGALTDRRRQNRRVDVNKTPLVEKVVEGLLHLMTDAHDRHLPGGAQPEVPVVEQEVDAVFLGLNRVVDRARTENFDVGHTQLVAPRGPRLGTNFAGDRDARFLRQCPIPLPDVRRHLTPDDDPLKNPGAIPHDHEGDLSGRSQVRHPSTDGDTLRDRLWQRVDGCVGCGHDRCERET